MVAVALNRHSNAPSETQSNQFGQVGWHGKEEVDKNIEPCTKAHTESAYEHSKEKSTGASSVQDSQHCLNFTTKLRIGEAGILSLKHGS